MGYNASFERLPVSACFDLKGEEVALVEWIGAGVLPEFPVEANCCRKADGVSLDHVGPRHWLLQANIDREDALNAALRPHDAPAEVSIVRISDTLTTFRITGTDAAHVLAIGCPLDLHEAAFPEDAVSFAELFGQNALVRRCAGGFDVSVEQSFGDMMEDCLTRALR
ncbi:MAG: sarcosine oxidase subunit gamma [Boseongicola sp. SB0677_bin_26]|nr:sarcosine oxidase subunit gamma [Boseongicola sp. SB0665_bin_10]MYG25963.1 sarcosine oxidase subunit gamma [Boseongicola sp. SB0677_bin_26]